MEAMIDIPRGEAAQLSHGAPTLQGKMRIFDCLGGRAVYPAVCRAPDFPTNGSSRAGAKRFRRVHRPRDRLAAQPFQNDHRDQFFRKLVRTVIVHGP